MHTITKCYKICYMAIFIREGESGTKHTLPGEHVHVHALIGGEMWIFGDFHFLTIGEKYDPGKKK